MPPSPRILAERQLHDAGRFRFAELTVRGPDGIDRPRAIVRHPGAVIILPILGDGRIATIRNHRYALNTELLELPAGTLEPGEDPRHAAERECAEETGYRPGELLSLGSFYTTPGLTDELMHMFVATKLTHVGQDLDEDEALRVDPLPPAELLAMLDDGRLTDGKTMLLLHIALTRGIIRR